MKKTSRWLVSIGWQAFYADRLLCLSAAAAICLVTSSSAGVVVTDNVLVAPTIGPDVVGFSGASNSRFGWDTTEGFTQTFTSPSTGTIESIFLGYNAFEDGDTVTLDLSVNGNSVQSGIVLDGNNFSGTVADDNVSPSYWIKFDLSTENVPVNAGSNNFTLVATADTGNSWAVAPRQFRDNSTNAYPSGEFTGINITKNTTYHDMVFAVAIAPEPTAGTSLFVDTFDRADSSDLNASTSGKSGWRRGAAWIEVKNFGDATDEPNIGGSTLRIAQPTADLSGFSVAYLDHNFTSDPIISAGGFSVSVDIYPDSGSGNTRFHGFMIGNSRTEMANWTVNLPGSFPSDFFFGYDETPGGPAVGAYIYKNGGTQDFYSSQSLGTGTTLSASFSFSDFNSGSTVNYEAFIDGNSVNTGSFTWSGTDENYLGLYSNLQANPSMDSFEVSTIQSPGGTMFRFQ